MSYPRLPEGFRFGAATSAYQIEGGWDADGKGPSIWDEFTARPGVVRNGETGRVAIDHYHRYAGDVRHLADAGLDDYRFSISWPRVVPDGTGATNPAGLDFYDRLVDALLAAGVRPVATLYHWDLPLPLQQSGGWLDRSTATAFGDYAAHVVGRLGDRVHDWLTLNEIAVHTIYGHALTDHAPALGLGLPALAAGHHQLLAHGLAVAAIRAAGGAHRVGIAQQHFPVLAASASPEDEQAAELFRVVTNWAYSDPLLLGTYPDAVRELVPADDATLAADLALITAPLDVYGVNYYEPTCVEHPQEGKDYTGVLEVDVPAGLPFSPVAVASEEHTDFGWAIVPAGLTDILTTLRDRYPALPPVVVTENGASFHDPDPDAAGRVADPRRIAFLDAHLRAVVDAIDAGVDVRGYYVWSAFDNFEWAAGYQERFGLVHVDTTSQRRTRKDSWAWFRDVIASQPGRADAAAPRTPQPGPSPVG
jgi:beta-glucosidase